MAKRKRKYVKGKPLKISIRIQQQYTGAINKLVSKMTSEVKREFLEMAKADYVQEHHSAVVGTMDARGPSSQARMLINRLKAKWDQLFGKLSFGLSPWFADQMNTNSSNMTRSSVSEMPNLKEEGRKLTIDIKTLDVPTKQILKSASASSADFIKSIPERYLNTVATEVFNSITVGNGLQDLEPFFEKQNSTITNWAHNTAMDQTRKTFNGLNKGRLQKLAISKGEWLHSGGSQHPRELHQDFDGQTFDLSIGAPVGDDGGNDVMPGEEPNCRCTFAPVVMFDEDGDEPEEE